jgi:hypothetical protein
VTESRLDASLLFLFELEEVSHIEGESGPHDDLLFSFDIMIVDFNGFSQLKLMFFQTLFLFVITNLLFLPK